MPKKKHAQHHHLKPIPTREEQVARFRQEVQLAIKTDGCMIIGVMGGEGGTVFAYTIGLLDTFQHPELLVTGLSYDDATNALNFLTDDIRAGRRFEQEGVYTAFSWLTSPENPLYFGKITSPTHFNDHFGQAQAYHQAPTFPAMQVVWSDEEGTFPWQEGFDRTLQRYQHFLFTPPMS